MSCLYCGKEIGFVRQIHDREFCCGAHRKNYGARLGRALENLALPTPAPSAIADFRPDFRVVPGNARHTMALWGTEQSFVEIHLPGAWPVSVGGVRGEAPQRLTPTHRAPFAAELCATSHAGPSRFCPALLLPHFELAADDEFAWATGQAVEAPATATARAATTEVGGIRDIVQAPLAEPVEAFLPPAPYANAMAFAAIAAAAPAWVLEPVNEVSLEPPVCGAIAAPAAEPVEALLPVAQLAGAMSLTPSLAIPERWSLEPVQEESFEIEGCGAVAAPAAEPVEALLPVAQLAGAMSLTPSLAIPERWSLEPVQEASFEIEGCGVVAAPAAEPVEALLPVAQFAGEAAYSAAQAALNPAWVVQPADLPSLALELCGPLQAPAAEPVEALFPLVPMAAAIAFAPAEVRLPETALGAVLEDEVREAALDEWQEEPGEAELPETVVEPAAAAEVAPPSEAWMAPPPACEVESLVCPVMAEVLSLEAAVQAPGAAALALAEPMLRESAGWQSVPLAEPVVAYVSAHLAESIAEVALEPASFCLPDLAGMGMPSRNQSAPAAPVARQESPAPAVPRIAASRMAEPVLGAEVIQFPALNLAQTNGDAAGAFHTVSAGAVAPQSAQPDNRAARLDPLTSVSMPPLEDPAARAGAGFPQGELIPMEFFCQHAPMAPRRELTWYSRKIPTVLPRFAMRTALDRLEDLALIPMQQKREAPSFTEIFRIADAARRAQHSRLRAPARAVAAALLMGVGLWLGAGSARLGRQWLSANTDWPSAETPSSAAGRSSASAFARVKSVFVPPQPQPSDGPIERVRHAIQNRAAAELTDSFRGMEAWGASANALPAGWSRNPDGYVRTGALALYHPSLNFTDYHLEFFGQIEKKGMSWAVRAADTKNYYALKFKVIEPGLRPVLAVVHYPVIGGQKGEGVETPLNVMIHNREPYRVEVDVKGDHITTSIEGEEVDSWTDDSLKQGGVGFFSDVGESAHIYWMKISKNQDWLGRVCAYLSGSASADTADLWRDDSAPTPAPRPSPRPASEAILASVENDEFPSGPYRARILTNGRTEPCKS